MQTQPDVQKLVRQTKRYEFLDGLRDVQLALVILAMGVVLWLVFDRADVWLRAVIDLKRHVGSGGRWFILLVVLAPSLLALLALPVMRQVRQRWLWRASGIVRPRRWVVPRWVTLISAVILLAGIVLGVRLQWAAAANDLALLRILIIASGWSLAYTLVAMGRLLDLPRYVVVGVLGGVASTLLLLPALTVGQTGLIWGVLWGAALGASGAASIMRYAAETDRDG